MLFSNRKPNHSQAPTRSMATVSRQRSTLPVPRTSNPGSEISIIRLAVAPYFSFIVWGAVSTSDHHVLILGEQTTSLPQLNCGLAFGRCRTLGALPKAP